MLLLSFVLCIMHPIVSCQAARATGLLPYAIINSSAVSTDHCFPLKTAVAQYLRQVPKLPKKTATRDCQKLPAQWVWKTAQLGGKTTELATLVGIVIWRQNATKYNSWHAGQRYIHHGMQAKHNQQQGLARANKLPNTTVLKLLTIWSAHRPSPHKHSPDGATTADIR